MPWRGTTYARPFMTGNSMIMVGDGRQKPVVHPIAPPAGMNPVAVEVAARGGAQVVWLPTVDSVNQRECTAADPEGARPPIWARLQEELRAEGIATDPVHVVDAGGAVLDRTRQVLRVIAGHGLTLATGRLGPAEIETVVDAAVEAGVRRIVITHPEFTSQRVAPEAQRRPAAKGALLERCFTTPYTGKITWVEFHRATGLVERFPAYEEIVPENLRISGP